MLNKEEMLKFVYDPNSIQSYILDKIEESVNGEIDIVDPTNPFTMLLESTAITASSSIIEMKNNTRKMYPALAYSKDELYPHLTDDVISNMFSIPAIADMVFYINMLDLKQNGYRESGWDYIEMTLPEYTEIVVANTTFTLLNDILIRLYDNGSVFIEQQYNSNDIAINEIGIINSVITSSTSGDSWLLFETKVKQVKRITNNDIVVPSEGFYKKIFINDQYFYSDVMYKNASTNNVYTPLYRSHSDEYIDPGKPTVYIKENDGYIEYRIPDVYLMSGVVSGNIEVVTYETKGNIYIPINNYTLEDYQLTLGNTGKDERTAVSPNVTILVSSRNVVDGGVDAISVEDLKKRIVYNTTGDIDLPITEYDIKEKAKFQGFELFKAMDIITDRLYIASKNTTNLKSDIIEARADVYNNTVRLVIGDLLTNDKVYVDDDIAIIKSNTVFKEDNGIVTIIDNNEYQYINSLTNTKKVNYFKDKRYFYTPYYYVIDKNSNIVNTRVYNLDSPELENIKIVDKNNNISLRMNIDKYIVNKTETGYKLTILPVLNKDFENVNLDLLKMQIAIPLVNSSDYIYYTGTYNQTTGYVNIYIDTDSYIDKDNLLLLKNGASYISNKLVDLNSKVILYSYIEDTNVVDNTDYLLEEIYSDNKDRITVITKETANLIFGTNLKYIWDRVHNEFSERMYLKHTTDKPLFYKEDVYQEDPTDGSIFTVDESGNIVYNILHHKGDPVLDTNGDQVYEYKVGDIVIGDDNLPVIDNDNGVIRYVDILMFELEYKLATSIIYNNYRDLLFKTVYDWIYTQVTELNNLTLENTDILYRSYKSSKPVKININNVTYSSPYSVSPIVTLYSITNEYTQDEMNVMKKQIGDIIHDVLDGIDIKLSDIKQKIIAKLGSNIVGVKITGLDTIGDLEVFNITDKATRLTMNKILKIDNNNDLIVNYDLTLNIQKV